MSVVAWRAPLFYSNLGTKRYVIFSLICLFWSGLIIPFTKGYRLWWYEEVVSMVKQQLTSDEKRDIMQRVKQSGESVASVAKYYGRCSAAVYKVLNGTIPVVSTRCGAKLTNKNKRIIDLMVTTDPRTTARYIKERIGKDVALSSIHRYLNKRGFVCHNTKSPRRYMQVTRDDEEDAHC